MMLNKFMGIGRLGQDPLLKHTPSGNPVCNFSMAFSEKYKGKDGEAKEKTEWINFVAWGNLAELCNKYLKKGSQTYVEGKIQTRSYDDKNGVKKYITEVNVLTVQFLSKVQENQNAEGSETNESQAEDYAENDIPF